MIYNIKLNRVVSLIDCAECKEKNEKRLCNGFNKCCFEYDEKTKTIVDGVTKMPLDITKLKGE